MHESTCVAILIEKGHIPRGVQAARPGSARYEEWEALSYEATWSRQYRRDEANRIGRLDETLSPPEEKPPPFRPSGLLTKQGIVSVPRVEGDAPITAPTVASADLNLGPVTGEAKIGSEEVLSQPHPSHETVLLGLAGFDDNQADCDETVYYHEGTDLHAAELTKQLAELPILSESPAPADVRTAKVGDADTPSEDREQMLAVLEQHKDILLVGDNILPPTARGVACDIDVGDARPIAQRARRVPPEHLVQLYDILKKLLQSGAIKFSNSAWASPIVIVLKKDRKLTTVK